MKLFIKKNYPIIFKALKYLKGTDYLYLIGKPNLINQKYVQPVISIEEGNDFIHTKLISNEPCFITRYGSAELSAIINYMLLKEKKVNKWHLEQINNGLFRMGALFPPTVPTLEKFSELYIQNSQTIDGLGIWYNYGENLLHKKYFPTATLFPIESLEPFRFLNPWSLALKGKKILVVIPFKNTVLKQYKNRNNLFNNSSVLPDCDINIYKPFNSYTDTAEIGKDWFYYLQKMQDEIVRIDFDIALISAGPFGLPLAATVKKIGKKAVHVGGALQLLFGIKGKRWEERPFFSSYMNNFWVRPSNDEMPSEDVKRAIDNSSYW